MRLKQRLYISCVKRPFDFVGALVAMVVFSPLLLIVAVVLHFANKGAGAFFVQERPGKGERIFKLVKFKTMNDQRDADGKLLPDYMRLTKVGRFVRSLSIDELPQLVNILMGDMSFIGPRPLMVKYLPLYSDEQRHRHDVTPGLSGWAQVNGRNNITWTEKFQYDVEYVQKIGFKIDFEIFIRTLKLIVTREGINQEGGEDGTMDAFNGHN